MDEFIVPHLPERAEVDMPIASVPEPEILHRVRSQAHGPCDLGVEDVQTAWAAVDLGEQAALLVVNPHDSAFDKHLKTNLVELPNTDDVGGQSWYVVGIGERAVLPILAREEDCAAPFNFGDGACRCSRWRSYDGGTIARIGKLD